MAEIKDCILAIDQGTSSTRCILFSLQKEILYMSQLSITTSLPQAGWVEINPKEILDSTLHTLKQVELFLTEHPQYQIKTIGLTNQRETVIAFTSTGKPLYPAIVWSDSRTTGMIQEMIQTVGKDGLRDRTGLPLSTYFSASKMKWMLEHVREVQEAAEKGILRFGTVDAWLLFVFYYDLLITYCTI